MPKANDHHALDHARVAFLGPAGTFTHAAAREMFGRDARYDEVATIDSVFEAVRDGSVDFGVVPIENSTEGSVTHAVDALIENGGEIVIQRELVLEISQCLMSSATDLRRIERVYSHPQALAQCREWLAKHLPGAELVQATSTAAAARQATLDASSASIGSRLAAQLYALQVLRDDIHDVAGNSTRFVTLATHDAPPTGWDKTSVAFAIHDSRGALLRVLEVFDSHGINLTRIESRPTKQRAWDYVFLADLDGHRTDTNVCAALTILAGRCPMLRILGSFPRQTPVKEPTE